MIIIIMSFNKNVKTSLATKYYKENKLNLQSMIVESVNDVFLTEHQEKLDYFVTSSIFLEFAYFSTGKNVVLKSSNEIL